MFSIWGIINLSKNSFYPDSYITPPQVIKYANDFLECGADMIDIGAESTRPFSQPITWEDEWNLLKNSLADIKQSIGDKLFSEKISIDTYKPEVANRVLDMGVRTINDVQGLQSAEMVKNIATYGSKVVIMHTQGSFTNMQINPQYTNVTHEVLEFLRLRTRQANQQGIMSHNIIWDIGIGFGKTAEHNIKLLQEIDVIKQDGYAVMVGLSRKSFISKLLDVDNVRDRGCASLILHTYLACTKDIDILRVHDVQDTVHMRSLLSALE